MDVSSVNLQLWEPCIGKENSAIGTQCIVVFHQCMEVEENPYSINLCNWKVLELPTPVQGFDMLAVAMHATTSKSSGQLTHSQH